VTVGAGKGSTTRVRKVQVGPFRLPAAPPEGSASGGSRGQIAGRYRRHLRGVALGHREVVDVDESVRKVVPREVRRTPSLGGGLGVGMGGGLGSRPGRGTDEDDDE
jgi:hypothetical protein